MYGLLGIISDQNNNFLTKNYFPINTLSKYIVHNYNKYKRDGRIVGV